MNLKKEIENLKEEIDNLKIPNDTRVNTLARVHLKELEDLKTDNRKLHKSLEDLKQIQTIESEVTKLCLPGLNKSTKVPESYGMIKL